MPRSLFAVLAFISGGVLGSCADEWAAPYSPPRDRCPSVDEYIEPLLSHLEDGEIQHIEDVIGSQLSDAERSDLVAFIIRLTNVIEPSSLAFDGLERPGLTGSQQLGELIKWIAWDAPGAPYLPLTELIRNAILNEPPDALLRLATAALNDRALLGAIRPVIDEPGVDFEAVVLGLTAPTDDPPAGLRQLVATLLDTMIQPEFEVASLASLLRLLVDVSEPPWSDAMDALDVFMSVPQQRADTQRILETLILADPDLLWVNLFYDLATAANAPAFSLGDARGGPPEDGQELELPTRLINHFRSEPASWRAVSVTLDALLHPQNAQGVMLDFAGMLSVDGLGGLLEALSAASARGCALE